MSHSLARRLAALVVLALLPAVAQAQSVAPGTLPELSATAPVAQARPQYPVAMADQRQSGAVRLRFVIADDGRVQRSSVKVVEASHPAFVNSAVKALVRTRFTPQAEARMAEQKFTFRYASR
ncbi:MAG: TonB family protein [Gemmatimonadales bacterium]|nr:TonB family protein [Gemmatimonadales bacterium]